MYNYQINYCWSVYITLDRSRASSSWPWPSLLGAGPSVSDPDLRTYRAGPGRTSGHGPLALPVDSLVLVLSQ